MTPLLPTPDDYLYNLIAMTSSEAKRLWRRGIKEHFDCTCIYCGETYDINDLTIDHVHPRCRGGGDTRNTVAACLRCNQDKGSQHWREFVNSSIRTNIIEQYINNDTTIKT